MKKDILKRFGYDCIQYNYNEGSNEFGKSKNFLEKDVISDPTCANISNFVNIDLFSIMNIWFLEVLEQYGKNFIL